MEGSARRRASRTIGPAASRPAAPPDIVHSHVTPLAQQAGARCRPCPSSRIFERGNYYPATVLAACRTRREVRDEHRDSTSTRAATRTRTDDTAVRASQPGALRAQRLRAQRPEARGAEQVLPEERARSRKRQSFQSRCGRSAALRGRRRLGRCGAQQAAPPPRRRPCRRPCRRPWRRPCRRPCRRREARPARAGRPPRRAGRRLRGRRVVVAGGRRRRRPRRATVGAGPACGTAARRKATMKEERSEGRRGEEGDVGGGGGDRSSSFIPENSARAGTRRAPSHGRVGTS